MKVSSRFLLSEGAPCDPAAVCDPSLINWEVSWLVFCCAVCTQRPWEINWDIRSQTGFFFNFNVFYFMFNCVVVKLD